jgi:hypothetical protein
MADFKVGDRVLAVTSDTCNGLTGVVLGVFGSGVVDVEADDMPGIPMAFLSSELMKERDDV